MKQIEIFDTTLRDGEQATQGFVHGPESKITMARKLAELGVTTIEAGFPISSQGDFDAVSQIAREVHGPYVAALARTQQKDIERAWEAAQHSQKPTIHVFTYMVNSDALKAYGKTTEQIIQDSVFGVNLARCLIGDNKGRVEFSAQNSVFAFLEALRNKDETSLNFLTELYSRTIEAGASVINIPDTEGRALPYQMEEAIRYIRDNVRGLDKAIISVHCHNDLGMATANSLSAIRAGARQIECTMNGIGERAGNAALEEVVMGVWTHGRELDVDTAIRTEMLNEMSRIVSYHTQWDVQPNKSVVGSNALRHSSGIHQHGKIKGRDNGVRVYEVFGADTVGWTGETNQLTARSGKYGVKSRLDRLGYSLSLEDVDQKVMPLFERVADERRLVDDIDLRIIMSEVSSQPVRIEYISHSIIKELADPEYEGRVHLKIDGRERKSKRISRESDSTESGSIDTLCTAVDSVLPPLADVPILVYYDSRNVGKRHSAEAEVTIVLSQNGLNNGVWDGNVGLDKQVFVGRARHADVPTASVMAYVKAMDSYLNSISPKT